MSKNKIFLILVTLLLFLSCGKDKAPTGGPKDTEAPKIVDTEPANLTTNFKSSKIEFTFSEQIDFSSFKDAFRIFPIVEEVEFKWSPAIITAQFNENLKPDTVYYITITTKCKDLRGNSLVSPVQNVFSTGDKIPDFKISGEISTDPRADEYKGDILVSLYSSSDSTLVSRLTLKNKFNYSFNYLNPGKYIVSAFKDKVGNKLFNPETEIRHRKEIAVDEPSEICNLTLTSLDEEPPRIKNINYSSSQYAKILFDEDIKGYDKINIKDQTEGTKVEIFDSFLHNDTLEIVTEPIDTSTYELSISDIRDWKNNVMDLDSLEFESNSFPDSSNISLLNYTPSDGATLDSLRPCFRLSFNKIIAPQALKVKLINKENGDSVPTAIDKINGRDYTIRPDKNLRNYVPYQFIIKPQTSDYEGNTLGKKVVINVIPIIFQ